MKSENPDHTIRVFCYPKALQIRNIAQIRPIIRVKPLLDIWLPIRLSAKASEMMAETVRQSLEIPPNVKTAFWKFT